MLRVLHCALLQGMNTMKNDGRSFIVFVDETGFMMAPTVRRTLAPKGQTLVLKIKDTHCKISVIGAMALQRETAHLRFYFRLLKDNANFNGNSVREFIKYLREQLEGPITLLWDQYCIHRARLISEYLEATADIYAEEFSPCAPEWNQVDYVWSYIKYGRLANYCPSDLTELRLRITKELTLVAENKSLLKKLFSRAGLPLAGIGRV
jgi:transposase